MSKKFKLPGILLVIFLLAVPLVGCRGLTLTVSEPKDEATVSESPVPVSGSVSGPEATITINGVEVEVVEVVTTFETLIAQTAGHGTFYTVVELTEGENTIIVVATLGEETVTKTVTVTYTPSE